MASAASNEQTITMDQLAQEQEDLGKEIQRIISNYKKDSAERKHRNYYEERLKRLEGTWERFEATDNKIRILPNIQSTHPYFTTDYYHSICDIYNQYKSHFVEKIASFQNEANASINEKNAHDSRIPPAQESNKQQRPDPETKIAKETFEQPATGKPSKAFQEASTVSNDQDSSYLVSTPSKTLAANRILRRQNGIIQSLRRLLNSIQYEEQPKHYYQIKLQALTQYWNQIEAQNLDIWELTEDPSAIGYNIEAYIQLEEEVQEHQVKLASRLSEANSSSGQTLNTNTSLNLPKITIPKFDGDYLKWRQFSDLFTEMVHKQPMANVQKLWYLKTNLTGEAEKLVRHFALTDDNYSATWKVLCERYENPRLLVAALINKLLAQPNHASENASAAGIKNLHDTTQECLLGLENLNISTSNWDPLLLHILIKKLDRATHVLYEQSLKNPREIQTIQGFLDFLQTRFQSMEALGNKSRIFDEHQKKYHAVKSLPTTTSANRAPACISCKGTHPLFACKSFLKLSPSARLSMLRKHDICINCLKGGHDSTKCTLRGCTKCSKRHNTLVHIPSQEKANPILINQSSKSNSGSTANEISEESTTVATITNRQPRKYILLGTVKVKLINGQGQEIECRAILDSGSQINLITEKLRKRLNLKATVEPLNIHGIGMGRQYARNRVNVLMKSKTNGFSARLEAFVLPQIIGVQPTFSIDTTTWSIPHNIELADPDFNRPDHIDLLLGAEFYPQILSIGQIKLGQDLPILQNTVFGWTVSGSINQLSAVTPSCGICTDDELLNHNIEKFWKMEEIENTKTNFTPTEKQCERHFTQTVTRNQEGRFIVKLPLSEDAQKLGESKDIAIRRFAALERKLSRNPELRQQYVAFMEEYLELGHMVPINMDTLQKPYYFLPHHSVLKPDSSTTKLRVVFDASAKTTNNISLNDILYTGPTIQDELFSILLRFRLPRFVFTADIQKMYRQVLVAEEDRQLQLILWRKDPTESLQCYKLCTVTYGTASAPYLATKCLQKLAQDRAVVYPVGSQVLQRDFYMDDVMTGSNSIIETLAVQEQLIKLLQEGGFTLRKWCANHPKLLQGIRPEDQEIQLDFDNEMEEHIKTLGLTWLPKSDKFCIKISSPAEQRITKRTIASDIAKLFDPLGIMAPVVITAKLLLQELWELRLDWDAAIPQHLYTRWINFRQKLKHLNDVQFPRHIFGHELPKNIQMHAFADASEKAYGAAIYLRFNTPEGRANVQLLCAKSRVAPLKKTTLPRLELCAAKLASELATRVKEDLKYGEIPTYFWTDSEIVLAWINAPSSKFQTFVANRVAAIQNLTIPQQWRHVNSRENPADVVSRGISPDRLLETTIWFYGPLFLHGKEAVWPPPYTKDNHCELELKRTALPVTTTSEYKDDKAIIQRINHSNSFRKLQRVVAYILRFIRRTRKLDNQETEGSSLTPKEMEAALHVIVKFMQKEEFHEEILQLRRYEEVSKGNALADLAPFLDDKEIIRVGGRLKNSTLPYDARHPILLPYKQELTKLLMIDLHKEHMHVGPQTLLNIARQRFWILKGKSVARSVVHHCIRCTRAKPQLLSQLMGNLPPTRVQPARPFINSGVDFCGPITIHYKLRGKRPHKGYIAVFCCFATKAVHLEVVSDLTTEAFIAALKRFTGRRGHCQNLYCDNATNFVGARNQLAELKEAIHSSKAKETISKTCSTKGIKFHFIPPRAPHFGGLWEAAVKSAKHLLQRSIASASLTYEELETVVVEVEAILNSRPITPMSSNPNDLCALTPGHFLIGEPLVSTIDANAEASKSSSHSRWRIITHLKQEFWRRWSREYLNELQYRLKWKQRSQDIQINTIVILKEDNLPVMKWPLGRILKTYKGDDGHIRVADVKTATGILRRPIHRLAPLPIEEDNELQEAGASHVEQIEDHQGNQRNKRISVADEPHTSQDSSESNESPRKKLRRSIGSTMLTMLLTCLFLPAVKANPIEISPFRAQPTIHFDHAGTLSLSSTEWNLIVYYDMTAYWMEYAALVNGTEALQHLCKQISLKGACIQIINQLRHIKDELEIENGLLWDNSFKDRTKRGAFDIIGNVANSLFGVLDSKYAEEMARTIQEVKDNENHLISLLKNQTSLIDSTLNIMRRDQLATEAKFQSFDNQLTQLINRINTNGEELHQQRLQQLFLSLSVQISLIPTSLQRIQSSIIDVLTDVHHGKISPLLLTPQQLNEGLMVIKSHLPPTLRLPRDYNNLLYLYQLMSVKGRVARKYVIFQIKLPLADLEKFNLFKVLPVPTFMNNTFVAIKTYTDYLAVTPHQDRYYPLNENELAGCTNVADNENYLCRQRHPIYHRGSDLAACEINL